MYINQTSVTYFIIRGISDDPEIQIYVFIMVLIIYLITVGGNMTIFLLICIDHHLHTPMYCFLTNLSVVDLFSSTIALNPILSSFITRDRTISFLSCMTQSYIFGVLIGTELLTLTAMSYDRYVAICKPLKYHMIMNTRTCALLMSACWLVAFLQVLPLDLIVYHFTCYSSIEVNHFFCDVVALFNIFCNDISFLLFLFLIEGLTLLTLAPFVLTFIPYLFIIVAILKIRSSQGRRKAFYTCSSHLTVVTLLYITIMSQYMTPQVSSTLDSKKLYALFNTAAVPMLNPLIYSLRNKDVKKGLRRCLGKFRLILLSDPMIK